MKLSKAAHLICRGSKEIKQQLAEKLGASATTVYRWVSENAENGPLTRAAALEVLRDNTGLADEHLLIDVEELAQK